MRDIETGTISKIVSQDPRIGLVFPLFVIFLLRVILLNQLMIHNWRIGKINSVYDENQHELPKKK